MTQLDPHLPTGAPVPPDDNRRGSPRPEPGFNWRITVGMVVGLVVLFGVLFGLRALQIFPAEPGQDAVIAAARATQAALGTQEALAPRPTVAVSAPAEAQTARPTVGPATSVGKPAAATPASVQQPAPAAAPAVQTAAPVAVATTQPVVAATAAPTPAPISAPTGQPTSTEVPAEPTPVQAAVPADVAAAIVQGYSNYWSLRVQAEHDPSDTTIDLESVMADNELIGARKTLSQYVDAGEAFDTNVKHQIWITSATADEAVIVDRYTATTSKLSPDTGLPTQANPTVENRADTFLLHRLDGVWKVVDEP